MHWKNKEGKKKSEIAMIDDRLSEFFFGRIHGGPTTRKYHRWWKFHVCARGASHPPAVFTRIPLRFSLSSGLTVIKNRWPILSTLSWFTMFLRVLSALHADGAAAQSQNEKAQRAMSPRDVSNYRYERACTRVDYIRGCLNAYRVSRGEKRNGIIR